jgi:hypothetical protein
MLSRPPRESAEGAEDVVMRAPAGADTGAHLASVTVSRNAPNDVGVREIYLSVDGERIATLKYGEETTCQLSPGPHRIRADNTLFRKTLDIMLQADEHAQFIAINRAGFGSFEVLLFLAATPLYLTFERISPAA